MKISTAAAAAAATMTITFFVMRALFQCCVATTTVITNRRQKVQNGVRKREHHVVEIRVEKLNFSYVRSENVFLDFRGEVMGWS